MSDWRIFFWAMLHSPEFKYCLIGSPIKLHCRWEKGYRSWGWTFGILFQRPKIYLPYKVQDEYYTAHSLPLTFDDIPF